MGVWTAYHDASGSEHTSDKYPMAIAGLCSTELDWLQFEQEWEAVLKHRRYNVKYLHMKEFAHSTGEFATWKGDEKRRSDFLKALTNVIAQRVKRCQILYVPPAAYDAVNNKFKLDDVIAGTYSLCALIGYTQILKWMSKKHPRDPLEQVFEAGDRGQGRFLEMWDREVALSDSFSRPLVKAKLDRRTGHHVRPFEAADFIAYEFALVTSRYYQGVSKSRQSFIGIFRNVKVNYMEANAQKLMEMCESVPHIYPPR